MLKDKSSQMNTKVGALTIHTVNIIPLSSYK